MNDIPSTDSEPEKSTNATNKTSMWLIFAIVILSLLLILCLILSFYTCAQIGVINTTLNDIDTDTTGITYTTDSTNIAYNLAVSGDITSSTLTAIDTEITTLNSTCTGIDYSSGTTTFNTNVVVNDAYTLTVDGMNVGTALTNYGATVLNSSTAVTVTSLDVEGSGTIDGSLIVTGSSATMPTTTTGSSQGLGIYWNESGGNGEVDFLSYGQGADGGFGFYCSSNTAVPSQIGYFSSPLNTSFQCPSSGGNFLCNNSIKAYASLTSTGSSGFNCTYYASSSTMYVVTVTDTTGSIGIPMFCSNALQGVSGNNSGSGGSTYYIYAASGEYNTTGNGFVAYFFYI